MAYPTTPAPRSWWKPAPDPELPRISAKRAYGEVLVVYAGFFAAGIVAAALIVGGHQHDFPSTSDGSLGVYGYEAIELISEIGLALLAVTAIAGRRGITWDALGLKLLRKRDGGVDVSQFVRICGWCFFAQIAGAVVNVPLQTGHLPTNTPNATELLASVFDAASAGIIEELVVLAFVVVSLRQAGRPWWEVTTVALVLRGAYHIYYGPGVVGILLWAALYFWIYLRFRQVVPLMLCHFMWDGAAFFGQRWSGLIVLGALVVVGIWIACLPLWLVARSDRGHQMAYAAPHWPGYGPAGPGPGPGPGPGSWGGAPGPTGWPGSPAPGPTGWPASPATGWPAWPATGSPASGPPGSPAPDPLAPPGSPGPSGSTAPLVGAVAPGSPAPPSAGGPEPAGPTPALGAAVPAGAGATRPAPGFPPPGWHPDPAGHNRWRWWNGHAWTDHVSRHANL
ncbi:MAG TPA: CPBP family glutamic-type intramembrane protease [Acidimicrobiales bacterium]|nr:CPBP family glutamic-type intramembrane protease [Acidimicrobiales bacterium]